jgi:hypothetical protein
MDEPVAMRYDFDGYGYMYIDSGSGSDWQTREKGEFLYTKPFFQQKPVAMMVKIDGFDKPEFTTICGSDALKHPNYTALYDHPMPNKTLDTRSYLIGRYDKLRELTDEEILDLCPPNHSEMMNEAYTIEFARAILKKARKND